MGVGRRPPPTLLGVPVTMGTLRSYVFNRDGGCIFRFEPGHQCRAPLELAHVPERGQNAYGRKPPDDEYHTVCECSGINAAPTKAHREFERAHLAKVES